MNDIAVTSALVTMAAALALGSAGPAGATLSGTQSAADTIATLEAQGHHVQINGSSSSAPLSLCKTTGVHGLRGSHVDSSGNLVDDDQFNTVYVDVVCHNP